MQQIIVYDIEEDALRTKVSNLLQDYGYDRVQFSVFIGSRTQNVLKMLEMEIKDLIGKKKADVRFYQQCDRCVGKTMIVSEICHTEQAEVMFPCHAQ